MKITYSPAKDAAHHAKHKISLAESRRIEWETLWAKPDARRDYGEVRMVGFAYIGLRLHCVVYTDRGDMRRTISLRKANPREIKRYAKA